MAARTRPLTDGELALAQSVFGDTIDYAGIRLVLKKWIFFQPRETVMSPCGHIHFHPKGHTWCDDFATADMSGQGLFVHEMTHIWQHQRGINLPLKRHPFCRYDYAIKPGWKLHRYGLEQQAEIVRHTYLIRKGLHIIGAPPREVYEGILPFGTRG